MSWADDLKKITDSGIVDMRLFASKLKFDTFADVIKRTRVDEGRLRGNWQISDGQPETGTLDVTSAVTEGQIPTELYSAIQKGSTPDGVTYFVNNLPYAKVYEEKDAMVGAAVAAMKARANSIARSIK